MNQTATMPHTCLAHQNRTCIGYVLLNIIIQSTSLFAAISKSLLCAKGLNKKNDANLDIGNHCMSFYRFSSEIQFTVFLIGEINPEDLGKSGSDISVPLRKLLQEYIEYDLKVKAMYLP
jgi:hypothetical protein